jgi:ferritin-like metal-binding protein YciE
LVLFFRKEGLASPGHLALARSTSPCSEAATAIPQAPNFTAPGRVDARRQQGGRVMGLFSTPIKTLNDLFLHTLQDIYYAEQQIVKNLPTMVEKSSNIQLKNAFQAHLEETRGQITRLEQVFQKLGQPVKGVTCPAIDGILSEAKELISDCGDAEVCDAAMLSAAQAVEHYEIARYGTLIAFARQLGRLDCAQILGQTLAEEKSADQKLSSIAEGGVNRKAA